MHLISHCNGGKTHEFELKPTQETCTTQHISSIDTVN